MDIILFLKELKKVKVDIKYNKVYTIQSKKIDTKDKIKKIAEGCQYLMDNDLDFLVRVISVMREEYVKHSEEE